MRFETIGVVGDGDGEGSGSFIRDVARSANCAPSLGSVDAALEGGA